MIGVMPPRADPVSAATALTTASFMTTPSKRCGACRDCHIRGPLRLDNPRHRKFWEPETSQLLRGQVTFISFPACALETVTALEIGLTSASYHPDVRHCEKIAYTYSRAACRSGRSSRIHRRQVPPIFGLD